MPVYMVQAGEHGPVKIGFSADVALRLVKMQADNHQRLTVLRIFQGAVAEEAALHTLFADNRLHGEWFSFTKAMMGDVGLMEILPEPVAVPVRPVTPEVTDESIDWAPMIDELTALFAKAAARNSCSSHTHAHDGGTTAAQR